MKKIMILLCVIAFAAMACWLTAATPPENVTWLARSRAGAREVRIGIRDGRLYAQDGKTIYTASWRGDRGVRTFLAVVWANDVSQCKAEWKGLS